MLSNYIARQIKKDDKKISKLKMSSFVVPKFNPKTHYLKLTRSRYFQSLIILRHYIKIASDYYFGTLHNAKNIDLFMLTPSISSPTGSGSNSKPISIKFGKLQTFLVDSSQFGFEPLLLNGFEKVYCYLPSMRGEDCDKRHLSQFYHCEMEMRGKLENLLPIIERYIKILAETALLMENIVDKISENPKKTKRYLGEIITAKKFPKIAFSEAVDILVKNGKKELVNFTKYGNDISGDGEIKLMKILKIKTPIWITHFDRDRVPFYQKPDSKNTNKVINADLLFPPLIEGSFGGEIAGAGQRQNKAEEIYESLKRQNISSKPYEWYIDLRKQRNYEITSGFGLGIERFIAWSLGKDNIRDVILYPRLKNIETCP
jgi:asparaginyl-tRNA synthetase